MGICNWNGIYDWCVLFSDKSNRGDTLNMENILFYIGVFLLGMSCKRGWWIIVCFIGFYCVYFSLKYL